jgi:hypothetical protein
MVKRFALAATRHSATARILAAVRVAATARAGGVALACWFAFAGPASAAEEPASARIALPDRPVWAGEVFDFAFELRIRDDVFRNLEGTPTWDAGPLVATPFSRPAVQKESASTLMRFNASGLALRSGTLKLLPAMQSVVLQTGTEKTVDSFRPITESVALQSAPASLSVRPLPAPPKDFSGAVGRFELVSSLDAGEPKVGQGVLWRVTLKGRGNWPHIRGLPPRAAPRSFDVAGTPKVQTTPGANLFEREMQEAVTLVPRSAGKFSLGPAQVVVFDPEQGEYVRLTAPAIAIDVAPGVPGEELASVPGEVDDLPATAGNAAESRPKKFEIPALLTGTGDSLRPMASKTWHTLLLAPIVPFAAFWLLLVWMRVRRDDPVRIARLAHRALNTTLARLMKVPTPEQRRSLVHSWEQLAARLLGRHEATPVLSAFAADGTLTQLWSEADVALYSRKGALPEDWPQRAQAWSTGIPLPTRKPQPAYFLWRQWLPPVLALILGSLAVLTAATATTPANWGERVASAPLDWVARYNLAVERASDTKYDDAAAHAAVAWLQRPQQHATQDLWQRLAVRAEFARPEIGGALRPIGPNAPTVATLATAGAWRWIAVAMAALIALGAAVLLSSRHGFVPRPLRFAALATIGVAAVILGIAAVSARSYGLASEPSSVLVVHQASLRSVPVESTTLEQRPPLPSGVLAVATKRFLRWIHLRLTDGREGWLREEQVIWIWGPADLD